MSLINKFFDSAGDSGFWKKVGQWAGVAVGGWVLISCISGGDSGSSKDRFTDMDALSMCQTAIKAVSRDPEKASIPYVRDTARPGSGEHYFAWNAGSSMLRLRNGLGLEVAATGACVVDAARREIRSLSINGESII